ncbi:MAG: peptide chain release factor 2 [Myxococcota bacterium]
MQRQLTQLQHQLTALCPPQESESAQQRLRELDARMQSADFWQCAAAAARVRQEHTRLRERLRHERQVRQQLDDCRELLEVLKDEETDSLSQLQEEVEHARRQVSAIRIKRMLRGPHDGCDAIIVINVGQGGVDAQDFAQMLLRMYKRYTQSRGYRAELADLQEGDEAGIKSATLLVAGESAYGYLKAEIGVHRLVRISPFDSGGRRHTSFAAVWVMPQVEEDVDIVVRPEDVRVDTFRAGGAGGQHVNKTDSAVRLTHEPTGIVVQCQSERSQLQNRATAMKLLKARLYELQMHKRLEEKNKAEAAKRQASFGSQIRNYVLAPYRLAKDLRTGYEVGNVDAVLDGDIQPFIEAYLLHINESGGTTDA